MSNNKKHNKNDQKEAPSEQSAMKHPMPQLRQAATNRSESKLPPRNVSFKVKHNVPKKQFENKKYITLSASRVQELTKKFNEMCGTPESSNPVKKSAYLQKATRQLSINKYDKTSKKSAIIPKNEYPADKKLEEYKIKIISKPSIKKRPSFLKIKTTKTVNDAVKIFEQAKKTSSIKVVLKNPKLNSLVVSEPTLPTSLPVSADSKPKSGLHNVSEGTKSKSNLSPVSESSPFITDAKITNKSKSPMAGIKSKSSLYSVSEIIKPKTDLSPVSKSSASLNDVKITTELKSPVAEIKPKSSLYYVTKVTKFKINLSPVSQSFPSCNDAKIFEDSNSPKSFNESQINTETIPNINSSEVQENSSPEPNLQTFIPNNSFLWRSKLPGPYQPTYYNNEINDDASICSDTYQRKYETILAKTDALIDTYRSQQNLDAGDKINMSYDNCSDNYEIIGEPLQQGDSTEDTQSLYEQIGGGERIDVDSIESSGSIPPTVDVETLSEAIKRNSVQDQTNQSNLYESIYISNYHASNRNSIISHDQQSNSLYGRCGDKAGSDISYSDKSDDWVDVSDSTENEGAAAFIV